MKILNQRTGEVLANRAAIAQDNYSRLKGLLGRNKLSFGEGLWIIPCSAIHTVGMRFPIDAVALDSKRVVLDVRSLPPGDGVLFLGASSVIELPQGVARQTKVGDQLIFGSANA